MSQLKYYDGSAWVDAVIGAQGATGTQGIQGLQGTQGILGPQGIVGVGIQGVQGTTGIQGTAGSGGGGGGGWTLISTTDVSFASDAYISLPLSGYKTLMIVIDATTAYNFFFDQTFWWNFTNSSFYSGWQAQTYDGSSSILVNGFGSGGLTGTNIPFVPSSLGNLYQQSLSSTIIINDYLGSTDWTVPQTYSVTSAAGSVGSPSAYYSNVTGIARNIADQLYISFSFGGDYVDTGYVKVYGLS